MNETHLKLCSSAEWAETVERWIIPWVLESVDLGDDVIEVGPGPGLTTDVLRTKVRQLTAVEIHDDLAAELARRYAGTNVEVLHTDATRTSLPNNRFTGAVCLTMLHHLPSAERQDALFVELCRVLRPAGILVGQDSLASAELRLLHIDDTYVPIDPASLGQRLEAGGFTDVRVDTNEHAVRFRATKPNDAK
ncbi:MAG: class I SAM-dependent methyltransferase [Acidimicrobiia bacterium]